MHEEPRLAEGQRIEDKSAFLCWGGVLAAIGMAAAIGSFVLPWYSSTGSVSLPVDTLSSWNFRLLLPLVLGVVTFGATAVLSLRLWRSRPRKLEIVILCATLLSLAVILLSCVYRGTYPRLSGGPGLRWGLFVALGGTLVAAIASARQLTGTPVSRPPTGFRYFVFAMSVAFVALGLVLLVAKLSWLFRGRALL